MADNNIITNLASAIANCDTDTWANPDIAGPDCIDAWGNPIPEGKEMITTPAGQKICVQKGNLTTADANFIADCPEDDFNNPTQEGDIVLTLDSCEKINLSRFTANEEKLEEICRSLQDLCSKTDLNTSELQDIENCLVQLKSLQTSTNLELDDIESCLLTIKTATAAIIANQSISITCLQDLKELLETLNEVSSCVPKEAALTVTTAAWGA